MNRRSFAFALGGALSPLPALLSRVLQSQGPTPVRRMLQLNPYATDAETPLDLLTDYLTPNDRFFIRHHWRPEIPDLRTWRLLLDGQVSHPLSLSLAELRRMPRESATCVLQCAGNGRSLQNPPIPGIQWGLGAVGNARWTGVRVKVLLDRAGVRSGAPHLHSFGTDRPPGQVPPFYRSLELEKALEHGLIAFEMNGRPLPPEHGGPARLVVPGWAGDHWMKWLSRLSVQPEPQKGFYMDVAYRYPKTPGAPGVSFRPDEMNPVTELFVKSNFTRYPAQVPLGATALLRGFALSGAPDITRVEVSADDGATWTEAALDPRHDPYAWRLWSVRWSPPPGTTGRVRLVVRATDSRGSVQPRSPVWNQSGYLSNGWHAVDIEVTDPRAPVRAEAESSATGLPGLGDRVPALPDGPGRSQAETACTACHSTEVLRQQRLTERQWTASIGKMRGWGASIPEGEESNRLIGYLAEHFGPSNDRFRPVVTKTP